MSDRIMDIVWRVYHVAEVAMLSAPSVPRVSLGDVAITAVGALLIAVLLPMVMDEEPTPEQIANDPILPQRDKRTMQQTEQSAE